MERMSGERVTKKSTSRCGSWSPTFHIVVKESETVPEAEDGWVGETIIEEAMRTCSDIMTCDLLCHDHSLSWELPSRV